MPKVAVLGLGSIGLAVTRLLREHRPGHEIVAAATLEPAHIGRSLGAVLGSGDDGPVVVGSRDELLAAEPEVVLACTGSFVRDTADDVVACARAGANVISPCEELAFPFNRFPEDARRIHEAALDGGVTVLGTGVNPGFMFDSLLAALTGTCWDVRAIRGRRVVDVTGFGENIHLRLGIGYTPEDFERGHAEGTIAGHVGFPESIEMVAERIGLQLDGPVEEVFDPLIAATAAPTRYGEVAAGRTEGFVQRATGSVGGEPRIQLELVLHLRPASGGLVPADTIEIDGTHPVRLAIEPGMDAILATSAGLVNSIPAVVRAHPGLLTVKDLPAAAAWVGEGPADGLR